MPTTFTDLARATTAQRGWCPTPRAVAAVLLDAAGIVADRLSAGVYAVITPTPFVDDDVRDLIAEAIAPRETRSFQEQPQPGEILFLTDATPKKFASEAIVKATAVGASVVYVADDLESFPSAYPASAVTRFDIANRTDDALVAAVLWLTHETETDGRYGDVLVPDDLLNLINPRAPITDVLDKLFRLADERRSDNSPPAAAVPIGEVAKAVVTRLRDLSGYGEAKTWGLRLAEDLHAYKVGEIEWQDVDCGVLLSGPPGCGKTFFANALAAECEVPLIATSYSDWHTATVGDTVNRSLAVLFKAWRKKAADSGPIIVFVDEIDSIGARGDSSHNDGWYRTIINAWLAFLDGAEPRTGIVVIAATNLPEKIDPALCRPGRLDRHVKLPTPTIEDLKGILKFHLGAGAQEDDLPGAAVACRGRMPAQIAQAARDARRVARRARRKVKASDVARLVRAQRRRFPADLDWSTAIYEAAHALIAVVLGVDLVYVDLDESHTMTRPQDMVATLDTVKDHVTAVLAGRAAEALVLGAPQAGAIGDLEGATRMLTGAVAQCGLDERITWLPFDKALDDPYVRRRVTDILADCDKRVRRMLVEHDVGLRAVAAALVKRRYLDADEVKEIVSSSPTASAGYDNPLAEIASALRSERDRAEDARIEAVIAEDLRNDRT